MVVSSSIIDRRAEQKRESLKLPAMGSDRPPKYGIYSVGQQYFMLLCDNGHSQQRQTEAARQIESRD